MGPEVQRSWEHLHIGWALPPCTQLLAQEHSARVHIISLNLAHACSLSSMITVETCAIAAL